MTDNNREFSYRLTESILSQTVNSTVSSYQQTTPRLVTPLPQNAIVVQPRDSDSSFNNYIGTHFKEDAPVLLDRLNVATPTHHTQKQDPISSASFWTYLSNDLDAKPPHVLTSQQDNNNEKGNNNTWSEYDSIFAEQTSSSHYLTVNHFFSLGAFLFLFGFIFPPLWWIGSFFPVQMNDELYRKYDSDYKMIKRWRTLNRFFSLGFSTLLIIAIIILVIIYSKTK
ncbi:uncharacterized protein BX663DRAFT_507845 [Cokeromyces recurvatus]|uniref:uncharacterized protein n=1 Tax=Cokeromyces recurvatus TaxID=90255 RepID=UPI00221E60A6|nr:uncharacterized protein BX663DRAFT_507845 [Cokeromyces recurvatus]KAI7903208.1 hypothetical protein BX663DRAFT_507845 [Cokeromyces recurvatus]